MWLVVLRSCWVKAYKLMTRYLFNMLSGFVAFYIAFALLFFGAKSIGGGVIDLGDTLEGIIAGYFTWMLAIMGSTELAWNVTNEAQTGTLEQQYLSPVGYRWIAVFTESFNFVYNVSLIFLFALVMAATTGQKIHLHLAGTLPVCFLCTYRRPDWDWPLPGLPSCTSESSHSFR
jgi:ABC-2 type transport system permease protein